MIEVTIEPGQEWEHETQGRCVAVEPSADPYVRGDSWIMRRASDGVTLYMHIGARQAGEWKRIKFS